VIVFCILITNLRPGEKVALVQKYCSGKLKLAPLLEFVENMFSGNPHGENPV
jgi:hypothetical protein